MAIELIRSAAEALRHSEDIAQLSSHSSLKLADKEYLLDGFKFLINTSDRHQQIRLLTLAPPEWGRTKVEEYFGCSRYLAQKSISLRESYGKLAVPVDWRCNTCLDPLLAQEIIDFQQLIRRIPVADNVIEYAVTLVSKTRPNNPLSNDYIKNYLDWGAGPRASQNLILAAKANAAFNGKFSPDIEDVKAVATGILRHRIIKNYKADAEGITEEMIIGKLL